MREWKKKVNQGEAMWYSASKKIINYMYIQIYISHLDTEKGLANLGAGEIVPAALKRISTRSGVARQ